MGWLTDLANNEYYEEQMNKAYAERERKLAKGEINHEREIKNDRHQGQRVCNDPREDQIL